MLWFYLFFLVFLKIPAAYLCYVVWWAVKDPPVPGDDSAEDGDPETGGPEPGSWWRRAPRRPHRQGPHGTPVRRPARALARGGKRTAA